MPGHEGKKKFCDRSLGFTARAIGSFKVLKKKIDVIKCLFKNKAGRQWGKLIARLEEIWLPRIGSGFYCRNLEVQHREIRT